MAESENKLTVADVLHRLVHFAPFHNEVEQGAAHAAIDDHFAVVSEDDNEDNTEGVDQ